MKFIKFIFVITGLFFLIRVPTAAVGVHLTLNGSNDSNKNIHTFKLNFDSIFLAENESKASESEGQPADENKDYNPDSETADSQKSGNNSDDAATRPVKPFKPSEEIAAEQAVDFPVDI